MALSPSPTSTPILRGSPKPNNRNPTKIIVSKLIDLTRRKFSRLTVISKSHKSSSGHWKWDCTCDCGRSSKVLGNDLRNGHTSSCGCFSAESTGKRRTTHGQARHGHRTKEYRVWRGMISRCTLPNNPDFSYYGGRGILVCDRWRHSFQTFLADIGPCPPGHSIERKDNNLGCFPDNCKWATSSEQALNRRTSRKNIVQRDRL